MIEYVDVEMTSCPKCERQWPWVSEQAASVEVIGHCIVCLNEELGGELMRDVVVLNTRLDENGTIAERHRREEQAGYTVEPCPSCLRGQYLKGWDPKSCYQCHGVGYLGYKREGSSAQAGDH